MTSPTPLPPIASPDDYLGLIGPAPTGHDLTAALVAASASVRRYCGWHVSPVLDETLTVDGSGGRDLHLPTLCLLDVTAVTNDDAVADVAAIEWSRNGYLRSCSGWSQKLRGVTVSITHGFDGPDVVALVCQLAARAMTLSAVASVSAEAGGGQSISYRDPGILLPERAELALYRLEGRP